MNSEINCFKFEYIRTKRQKLCLNSRVFFTLKVGRSFLISLENQMYSQSWPNWYTLSKKLQEFERAYTRRTRAMFLN